MTIHSEHPFADPPGDRDPLRRFRGRVGAGVSLWTAGTGTGPRERRGLTVSSMLVAGGEPGHVLGLLDPDADLTDLLRSSGRAVVNLLGWQHRDLAEAFAGLAPAPGGLFTLDSWTPNDYGQVLDSGRGWAAGYLAGEPQPVGWSLLVDLVVDQVEIGPDAPALLHLGGRYDHLG